MSSVQLLKLLSPKSVAVIGASERYESPGSVVILNMQRRNFEGAIYPVNPKYGNIHGLKSYKSIQELPEAPDCVLICVKAGLVPVMLREAAEFGAGAAVIYASGFKETGESGAELQEELIKISKTYDIPFCGPNCIGPVNFVSGFSGFSANVPEEYSPGKVSAICQSGSVAIALLNSGRGIHFRYLISSGNEASVTVEDYIDFLIEDEGTEVILGFVESFKNIPKLQEVACRARQAGKTICLVKVGRTEFSQKTVASHTGALAGEDKVIDAVLKQSGIIRCGDLNELLESSVLFSSLKPPKGSRVGMVAISGGEISLLSDLCADIGIQLPELSADTATRLKDTLPPYSPIANPVDAWGNGDLGKTFQACIEAAGTDGGFDCVVVCLDVQTGMSDGQANYYSIAANSIVQANEAIDKPLIVFSNLGSGVHPKIKTILADAGIPVLQGTEPSLRAIYGWINQGTTTISDRVGSSLSPYKDERLDFDGNSVITEHKARSYLEEWGIPHNKSILANSFLDARDAAQRLGYPIAVKVDSPDIPHRFKSGTIVLNVQNEDALTTAYDQVFANATAVNPDVDVSGVSIQEMVDTSMAVEALVGIKVDPQCGPVVLFGVGGVHTEAFDDTTLRVAPFSKEEAFKMIDELRATALFASADRDALVDILIKCSEIAVGYQDQIAQLDINPLLVFPEGQGVMAVDALITASGRS